MSRILCVDDEDEVRVAVKRRLERDGHTVTTAGSAAEGIEAINAPGASYDVVITDMSMEDGESGLKMLKAAVQRDVFTEVIVLTAYGNVKNAVECMQHGAFDYVEKNIPEVDVFELLMLKVDRALQQRRATMRSLDRLALAGRTGGGAATD
ncbi:MAG TPA: response regulator [Chthonomonadaceae bacterium]|nr:response regulator [Chthonomonadaceae bacterium]